MNIPVIGTPEGFPQAPDNDARHGNFCPLAILQPVQGFRSGSSGPWKSQALMFYAGPDGNDPATAYLFNEGTTPRYFPDGWVLVAGTLGAVPA